MSDAVTLKKYDVVLERDDNYKDHPGNIRFLRIVRGYVKEYDSAENHLERRWVAAKALNDIENVNFIEHDV